MADLKVGSTTGGSVIWHQGNFPLNPAGDDVLYKSFKIYSEYNKPQAADNDFVSKANGGTYAAPLHVKSSINIVDGLSYRTGGLQIGNGDGGTLTACNIDLVSWYGIGFKSSQGGGSKDTWVLSE